MSHNLTVVKKRIKEMAEEAGEENIEPGSPEYRDLMANVEADAQKVLEEEGILEY